MAQWFQCLMQFVNSLSIWEKQKTIHLLHDMKGNCMVSTSVYFSAPCLIGAEFALCIKYYCDRVVFKSFLNGIK